jgi:hypothetical protein
MSEASQLADVEWEFVGPYLLMGRYGPNPDGGLTVHMAFPEEGGGGPSR